ncbi:MAG TPA: 50S ribosomal protein L32 [Bacteroidota bacterium]|nr:50S ribosomal protein L32 [Candidatus Kapabacteria bacterium]HRS02705.1 50S ribosomal protein L32 [Bacteroidota bacterium]HRT67508.1 50S ribosomal protein L32 [Bacteroidota bacterium]
MPNPNRRFSKSRRDTRRSHYKATYSQTTICPHCGARRLAHTACPECGYYNGRIIIEKL